MARGLAAGGCVPHSARQAPGCAQGAAIRQRCSVFSSDTPFGSFGDQVEAYEAKHYPLDLPDPVEAIKYTMESKGLTVKDLEPMIGRSNRVYEILSRKRPLILKMIWELHRKLGIPAESLVRPSKKARAA